jgi:hypothetical protein
MRASCLGLASVNAALVLPAIVSKLVAMPRLRSQMRGYRGENVTCRKLHEDADDAATRRRQRYFDFRTTALFPAVTDLCSLRLMSKTSTVPRRTFTTVLVHDSLVSQIVPRTVAAA